MSQIDITNNLEKARTRGRPKLIVMAACRANDVSLMKEATEVASLPQSRDTVQEILEHGVRLAISRNAADVLSYVLGEGAPVPADSHLPGEETPSKQILELLIAHGWDINARRPGSSQPFLWQISGDHDLVVWALDHGAVVHPKDQEPYTDGECLRDHQDCPPLLEAAVRNHCSIPTFDLLRSKGAPITTRVLHLAAEKAVADSSGKQDVTLIRHLLDKYNLDVNALDATSGGMGNHWGTPLCYIVHAQSECQAVVELLLERGADPNLSSGSWSAVTFAEQQNNTRFLEVLTSWKAKTANS